MLKKYQKKLRYLKTEAEYLLWQFLKNRQLDGLKFRRQHILQGYIVDFVCLEKKLIIEIDGEHHAEQQEYDDARTEKLNRDGFRVLRFWNIEVLSDVGIVLEIISRRAR